MKVVLSPAKALDMSREIDSSLSTEPIFLEHSAALIRKLSKMSAGKIGKMMSLSKDLASLNYDRYQEWKPIAQKNESNSHAIACFNGEVYRGFDVASMNTDELACAQDTVRILSGLYGILKPLDRIYAYRLEMGTRWAVTPDKNNLYKFWGTRIAEALNEEEQDVIINLASTEYFKAIDRKILKARIITPVFKDLKNGEYKTIMVFAKKARGSMARYIVQNGIINPEDVKGFDTDGYGFDTHLSSENQWVFTR